MARRMSIETKFSAFLSRQTLRLVGLIWLMLCVLPGGCCSLDNFVANKIGKVLIDIGKHTWPQEYPAMLEEIRSLCMSPTTFSTGLMLLGTVAVEFVSPVCQTSWEVSNMCHWNHGLLPV
jgi:hypothetical protein